MAPGFVNQSPNRGLSRVQVALAIAIVRSKPDELSIRDHLLKLRAHLKQGKQPVTDSGGHRHLDVGAYWRDRHDESEQRCRELEHRIVQLERAKDALQSRPDIEGIIAKDSRTTKRKGGANGSARSTKRVKASSDTVDKSVKGAQGSFADDLETLDGLGEGTVSHAFQFSSDIVKVGDELVRHLYISHKMYAKQKVDPEALCSSLAGTARAIGSVISTACRHYDQLALGTKSGRASLEKDNSDWSSVIRASSRAFTSVLLGLEKTSGCSDTRLPGLVVVECIKMFKTILDSISESAQTSSKARRTSELACIVTQPKSTGEKDPTPSRTLAHLLIAFFSALRKEDRSHREIFEGMLFVLTERVAKCLFHISFGRFRSPTVEGDIVPPPGHDHPAVIARQEVEASGVRVEARSLITILERAIALAPFYFNSPLSSKTRNAKASNLVRSSTRTLQQASRSPLSTQARDRLQQTLVQCMFGDGEHDEFADVLRMPARLGPAPNVPRVEEKDVGDWFSGEVWRLVGWDLLSREGQW
ncbi:hypothetical protein K491DRAFT_712374 [Lophiostoma macrostomum CBS 122681]|uniref:Uncharacterized protein n=1 Tax=Lophiostoma macrostomum CBS 122681 TaxID=1314788 RepID=A0A6A6TLN9_9PLEO|nr:hypothetical protein K491DRAFT_712374 [Lophiostoma macrostomum CBS 122681]